MSRVRRNRGTRDRGATLLEMMIAISVMTVISAALLSVVATFLRNDAEAEELIDESRDLQLLSTYLPSDVSSAFSTELEEDLNGNGTEDAKETATAAPCTGYTGTGNNVLNLKWNESFGGTTKQYRVNYRLETVATETRIVRVSCEGVNLGAATTKVVAHQLAPSVAPVVTINGAHVLVELTEKTGRKFTVVATSQNPHAELEYTSDYDD